jgi:predicted PurR-regulated permease PerM
LKRDQKWWAKWIFWFTLAVAIIAVYKTFDNLKYIFGWLNILLRIVQPFLFGFFIAYVLCWPSKKLERVLKAQQNDNVKRFSNIISVAIVYVVFLALLSLVLWLIIPSLLKNILQFANNFPGTMKGWLDWINNYLENDSGLSDIIDVKKFTNYLTINNLINQINISLPTLSLTITQWLANLLNGIFTVFISIIISIYMVLRRRSISRVLVNVGNLIFKPDRMDRILHYVKSADKTFHNYLFGQIIDGLIFTAAAWIIMLVLNVPYSPIMAVLLLIGTQIPYFGTMIGIIIVSLITLGFRGLNTALLLAALLITVQQIDGNVIGPKIVGKKVGLNPLWVILAITLGGGLFGFPGVLFGVPVMAVLRTLLVDLYDSKKSKKEQRRTLKNDRDIHSEDSTDYE